MNKAGRASAPYFPLTYSNILITYRCTIIIEHMNKQYITELAEAITSIKSPGLAESFLHNILTPAELEEISKRLQIVKLLMEGVAQRDVAKKLGVSMGTVSRGSREIKYGTDGFKKVLQGD